MIRRLRLFTRALFRRSTAERELDDELQFHIEKSVELHMARGMPEQDARRAALRQFGNVTLATEESREQHRVRLLEDLTADLRYAFRTLRRTPAFTAVAVLTVALGVGANTAIFGVIDAVLLRTLPVREPERLVFVNVSSQRAARSFGGPPYPWFEQIRSANRSYEDMAVFAVDHLPLTIDGQVEQALGQVASGSLHQLLGVEAAIGRTLRPEDERLSPPVAVLSHRYWQKRFGGREDVVGKVVRHDDRIVTIVGVTAPGFDGLQTGEPVDITVPVTMVGSELLRSTETWWCQTVARLRTGVTRDVAQAESERILASLDAAADARSQPDRRVRLDDAGYGQDRLRRQLSTPLFLLLAVVGTVLLIACANIANLLSVRAAARRRELAVRRAIGAGNGRLARQLLTESVVLFALGAAAGLFVAQGLQRFLAGYFSVGRNPIFLPVALDARVLLFTGLLALLSGVVAGLAPALRAARRSTFVDLRLAGSRSASAWPISRALVVVQVALSVTVLVAGSLFLRTLANLRAIDGGFRSDGVLTLSVQPLESSYPERAERSQVFDEVLRRITLTPGVQSASLSVLTPLSGRSRTRRLFLPGFEERPVEERNVFLNYVSPSFFETLGIRVRHGRAFSANDDARAPRVALMSEEAARFYFGTAGAVDRTIAFEFDEQPRPTYTVVGVVGDAKHQGLRDAAQRFLYLPLTQAPDLPSRLTLSVKTDAALPFMANAARREIQSVDTDILVSDVETLQQQVDRALLQERVVSSLSFGFAVLGVLLAALGLYGVTSYAVLRRTDEIGIRMALGSTPVAVRWLMLRDSLGMAVIGVAVGVPASLVVAATIQRFLYRVSPTDPLVLLTCVSILLGVTALAGYLPARRASRIDPVRALSVQ